MAFSLTVWSAPAVATGGWFTGGGVAVTEKTYTAPLSLVNSSMSSKGSAMRYLPPERAATLSPKKFPPTSSVRGDVDRLHRRLRGCGPVVDVGGAARVVEAPEHHLRAVDGDAVTEAGGVAVGEDRRARVGVELMHRFGAHPRRRRAWCWWRQGALTGLEYVAKVVPSTSSSPVVASKRTTTPLSPLPWPRRRRRRCVR